MSQDHQKTYHRAWAQLGPPLRPPLDVIAAIREQIKDRPGRALLLGVTPELADVAPNLVALDRNFSMVANIWPGNTASRSAVVGDWRNTNFAAGSFSVCIGDGSLSFLTFPTEIVALFQELKRIAKRNARAVLRLYLPPNVPETILKLRDEALAGRIKGFHAFKIRLGMSIASGRSTAQVGVAEILTAFSSLFPDRSELAEATLWPREQIDTIDHYKGSSVVFTFPTQDNLLSAVSNVSPELRLVQSGSYEMAELCPLLVVGLDS